MTSRQRQALQKYFTRKIRKIGPGVWLVQARKRAGKPQIPYTVVEDDDGRLECGCPKFQEQQDCNHTGAVRNFEARGKAPKGYDVKEDSRPTYPTDNVRDRAARRIMHLVLPLFIRALARHVFPITGKRVRGRPVTEMCDLVYGIALRAINGCGGAAAQAMVREAFEKRLMYHRPILDPKPPSEEAITSGMRRTETLQAFGILIERSNDPFLGTDAMIAVDGSEFEVPRRGTAGEQPLTSKEIAGLQGFEDEEKERIMRLLRQKTVKLCAAVSVADRMFTGAVVAAGKAGESRFAIDLIEQSRKVRNVTAFLGDKAYVSGEILAYLYENGIVASIPAKKKDPSKTSRDRNIARHDKEWHERTEDERDVYGYRQHIESAFSRTKRTFGSQLRSITFEAQQVELLCLVLLMNCRTLIEHYVSGRIDAIPWLDNRCRNLLDPARCAVEGHPHADRTPRYHDNLDDVIEHERIDESA